jgi:hypothetical protein
MFDLHEVVKAIGTRELTLSALRAELERFHEAHFEDFPVEIGPRELFEMIQLRGWCIPVRAGVVRVQTDSSATKAA